jgi:hypothetical protein
MNQMLFHHLDEALQHLVTASVELAVDGSLAYATVSSFSAVLPWLSTAYHQHRAAESVRAAAPHLARVRELQPGALHTWTAYLDGVLHDRIRVHRTAIDVLLDELVEIRALRGICGEPRVA